MSTGRSTNRSALSGSARRRAASEEGSATADAAGATATTTRQAHPQTGCAVPDCKRDGINSGMRVCAKCREWICKFHLQRHSLSCRGPTPRIASTALDNSAAGEGTDEATEGDGGREEQGETERHARRVTLTGAAGAGGGGRASYLEAAGGSALRSGVNRAEEIPVWRIFTDGGCKNNSDVRRTIRRAGWGFVAIDCRPSDLTNAGTIRAEACGTVGYNRS